MNEDTDGEPNSGEWIKWEGGECPVGPETRVLVKFRVDERSLLGLAHRLETSQAFFDHADRLRWIHAGTPGDVVAYCVDQP